MRWLALAGFLAASFVVGAVGNVWTDAGMAWYDGLEKPAFNPPSWVFGPVWTTLYILMAVAAWRVWLAAGFRGARLALGLYFAQLALNMAWPGLFFALQAPGWALAEIVALWLLVVATTVLFFRHDRVAGWLMVPYILWVAYAALLNGAIVALN